jgi:hypothetical protein
MIKKKSPRDYWIKHYHSFNAAGTTQREYCRTHNLCYWTFNKWKRQFDAEGTSTSLQQLPVKYQPVKTENIEIIINEAIKVGVPEHFSENTLRRIIATLKDEK